MLQVYPRVVAVNSRVTLRLLAEKPLFEPGELFVQLTACEQFTNEQQATQGEMISGFEVFHTTNKPQTLPVERLSAFAYRVAITCPCEQEYILRLFRQTEKGRVLLETACVYAVEADLQGLLPYKGDFHLHSFYSDGENSPACMAEACREKGFDFMALTDHGKFAPSQQLQAAFAAMPQLGLAIYTGEEIHLPWHQAHILNIGGKQSVNEQFLAQRELFLQQVKELEQTQTIPPQVDAYQYCAALWAFDRVRQAGGMSVFCHPYWRRPTGYELCANFTEAMLCAQPFDALELLSGYPKRESDMNQLQLARYFELAKKPPIVGVSDAHAAYTWQVPPGEYLLGSFYTMVLAASNRFEDVKQAICAGRSVAVEQQEGEQRHIYGSYRLVKYFQFLARAFFPEHDALAAREAAAMRGFEAGEPAQGLAPQLEQLYRDAFAWPF